MTLGHLEDFAVGQTFTAGLLLLAADDIKRFASEFDPQPFHLDNEAAGDSFFRGLRCQRMAYGSGDEASLARERPQTYRRYHQRWL